MKIRKLGEFGLIERIHRKFETGLGKELIVGIGDDTAVIKTLDKSILLTTDTLVENVHFDLKYTSYFDIGWKLLAANLSDIAAMGGVPKYVLITLGLRNNLNVEDIDDFYRGINVLAKKFKIKIVGGDVVSSPKSLFFTMGVYGEAKKVIRRSGAKTGDYIYYIGPLGESVIGLHLLRKRRKIKGSSKFINAHLSPRPLLKEGQKISKYATSMIDNSDGLARCLIEICKSSGVGAEVWEKELVSAGVKHATSSLNINPLKFVLHGGEDYGLLFTSGQKNIKIPKVKLIGRIIKGEKIYLIDKAGKKKELSDKGFKHF